MTPAERAALESLAAKYAKHWGDGKGFTKTQEEIAAGLAYPDTLNALIFPGRKPMPTREIPSTRVLEWWTAPTNHIALGEGIARWDDRNVAYRTEAACLDAIEAWAKQAVHGPHAAEICNRPTRPLGLFEFDDLERKEARHGKLTSETRLVSARVARDTNRHGIQRVCILATWEFRIVATRQEPVTTVVDGVECKGSRPVVTVIRDWAALGWETSWALEAERHVLDLKWAPESAGCAS